MCTDTVYGQYIQMKGGRYVLLIYFYTTSCTITLQVCEHFNVSKSTQLAEVVSQASHLTSLLRIF